MSVIGLETVILKNALEEKRKWPTWSQVMAAMIFIERAHDFVQDVFPQYSTMTENATRAIKKKLGLVRSLHDDIVEYIGTDKLMSCCQNTINTVQDPVIKIFLHKHLEIEKIICPKSGENCLDLYKIHELDFVERSQFMDAEADVITTREVFGPDFLEDRKIDMREGTWPIFVTFAKYKGRPIVLQVRDLEYENPFSVLDYIIGESDVDTFEEFRKDLIEELSVESPVKNWVISCEDGDSGTEFVYNQDACEDLRTGKYEFDIKLYNAEVQNLLTKDISGFIEKQNHFCEQGYDGRRAYMLEGPPGTGKSNIIRTIISILPENYTTIILDHSNIGRLAILKRYQFLFPALVVIEDIDLILGSKYRKQILLNFLDGINAPEKMITVMTSNNMDSLTEAITNRPGRVDRVFHVGPGDREMRIAQIKALTKGIRLPEDISVEAIANKTDGYTVAQLRELVRRATIYTSEYNGEISADEMRIVLDEFQSQQEKQKNDAEALKRRPRISDFMNMFMEDEDEFDEFDDEEDEEIDFHSSQRILPFKR